MGDEGYDTSPFSRIELLRDPMVQVFVDIDSGIG